MKDVRKKNSQHRRARLLLPSFFNRHYDHPPLDFLFFSFLLLLLLLLPLE